MTTSNVLFSGMSSSAALDAFVSLCKSQRDTLFLPDEWFEPYRARLVAALPATLTPELCEVLVDALYKRKQFEDVVEFVEQQPIRWSEYERWRTERSRTAAIEGGRAGIVPWEWVDSSTARSKAADAGRRALEQSVFGVVRRRRFVCPRCGGSGENLSTAFIDPAEFETGPGCFTSGTLVYCGNCHVQIDFQIEIVSDQW